MPEKQPELPIAHIYAPRFPHDPVEIIGNTPGLEHIINVLIDAVGMNTATDTIHASDRAEFQVLATCLRGPRRPEEWRRSGSPYWDLDDPLLARIRGLTEENDRLRKAISELGRIRKSIETIDSQRKPGSDGDRKP
jgi:hypothetical protein